MKVKLIELLSSSQILGNLFNQKLNGAVAFKVSGIVSELNHQLKRYDDTRLKIITDNGGIIGEGDTVYTFPSDDVKQKVDAEIEEVVQQEVELHARHLTYDDLSKVTDISPAEISMLDWAIEK